MEYGIVNPVQSKYMQKRKIKCLFLFLKLSCYNQEAFYFFQFSIFYFLKLKAIIGRPFISNFLFSIFYFLKLNCHGRAPSIHKAIHILAFPNAGPLVYGRPILYQASISIGAYIKRSTGMV